MRTHSAWLQILMLCSAMTAGDAFAGAAKQDQVLKLYEDARGKLKDDDENGYLRLAQWCQANRLTKEAEQLQQAVLSRKREKVLKEPTVAAYQQLVVWCTQQGMKPHADEVRNEMLAFDFGQRKGKLAADDAKGLQDLAKWCQQNGLSAQALDTWQAVLALQPDSAAAKSQIAGIRAALWAQAPTGLLKNQKVPGYTEDTAWYHISVPSEHKSAKDGMPLLIYLHGGGHMAGTADNIVAFAQVIPAFKKNIVLFPNHIKTWWAHPTEMKYLLATIETVLLRWHVDLKKVYLMGGSMGGNGTWMFGSHCSEMFAAISPNAGWYAENLDIPLKNLVANSKPVYILHGTKDGTVPIEGARKAFEFLKKEGANVQMREVDCGHQPPNDEIGKAAEWIMQYANKQEFDLKAIRERLSALPVPGWLDRMK